VFSELKSLSQNLAPGTLEQAQKYKRDPCVHAGKTTANDCILRLIGQKNLKKLFLATQDKEIRRQVRLIPAVPLIYFKHNILTLDPPSEATLVKAERVGRI
jgi:U3 small nucleolar RNA-associated protein 23